VETSRLNCVILAAGKGTRMASKVPKIAHPIMGKPMVCHVVATARQLGAGRTIVVTGHEREMVQNILRDEKVTLAVQAEQKGTAHALLTAESFLSDGAILVLYGDVPLIQASTLQAFLEFFDRSEGIVFMTTAMDRPEGYGRVIVGAGDEIIDIVEESEATPEIKRIGVINTGICLIRHDLLSLVKTVTPNNRKGEYYLTDICKVAKVEGVPVKAYLHSDSSEVLGINTRKELQEVNLIMRNRILDRHMKGGVTITDRTVYIEGDVTIGRDTTIFPWSYIAGKTEIGEDATIGPHTSIHDSVIEKAAVIEPFVSLDGAIIGEGAVVRSFSRIAGGAR
jgi:bifunctional UDP-N-acetylglucosamine pyrophosphorylase / glucosamine-1-phosphate N-acetyltransferase